MKYLLFFAVVIYIALNESSAAIVKEAEDVSNPTVCTLCKELIHLAYEYIEGDKGEIRDAVEKVCDHVPEALKNECAHIISTYGDEIIEMILNSSNAEQICSTIKACP